MHLCCEVVLMQDSWWERHVVCETWYCYAETVCGGVHSKHRRHSNLRHGESQKFKKTKEAREEYRRVISIRF